MRSYYHILPGDSIAGEFKGSGIEGDIIICRECLIDGPVNSNSLEGFWEMRAAFINSTYNSGKDKYEKTVKRELEKIFGMNEQSEVNLWFEFDLFCHANMWFVIHLLNLARVEHVNRVYPLVKEEGKTWEGFGKHSKEDIKQCYEQRVPFTKADLELGENLWKAYSTGNLVELKKLSQEKSACFLLLDEVCNAEIERKQQQRPQKALKELRDMGVSDFMELFQRFHAAQGVYGYGDLQVKKMLEDIKG